MSQQLVFDLNVDNGAAISSINTFFDAFEAGVKNAGASLDKQFGDKNKVIGIKLEGGKAVATEMNNMASIGNKLEKSVKVLNQEYGKTPREIRNSIALLKELLSTTTKYKEGTKKLTSNWRDLVKRLQEAKSIAKDMEINEGLERSITGANIAAGLALDAIRGLGRAVASFIQEGIEMEVLMIQLEGFTGGVQQAEKAFASFVEIAKATPFDVKQVAEASRTMMGFGISAGESAKRVEQLAIVAASTGGDLKHMARNLGQIQANQRAYTRDLMQFANQGIPIYQMLGEVMGRTTQQVRQMAEEGQVGFTEVAAALDEMTRKGSDYEKIAARMSSTFQSRLEEIASAVTTTSGHFVGAIQAMDKSLGGPIEKSMALVADAINAIGNSFKWVQDNARALTPVIATVATLMIGSFGIAAVQNLAAIGAGLVAFKVKLLAIVGVQKILNGLTAVFAALSGNFAALALAAGVAAAAGVAFAASQTKAVTETKSLTERMDEQETQTLANADAEKLLAFQYENVVGAISKKIEKHKEEFTEAQKGYNLAKTEMDRALKFLALEAETDSQFHKDKMERIKAKIEAEKQGQKDALEASKMAHDETMEGLNAELAAVRERYDIQLGLLEEESKFAKELRQIRIQEIKKKLESTNLSKKERLELQEQLHQIDTQVKRRELIAQKKEAEKVITDKIKKAEADHAKEVDNIKKKHEERIETLENAYNIEEKAVEAIMAGYAEQARMVQEYKDDELRAIYENRDAAIESLNEQIVKAGELKTAMETAYAAAKKANQEAARAPVSTGGSAPGSGTNSARASGGPVTGGAKYTVNELGKEAFLSASGRLSMINSKAFGTWKAPSSGTVIPAHLTKQLNVPSGGVNLNAAAGMNAGKAGGVSGMMAAIQSARGDTFNQSVTVQSANPVQAANNMMVEMTRLKRRRFS